MKRQNEHESQKRMMHDMMTRDKNRFQMRSDGKGVQARGRDEGTKDSEGSKGNMRRKRRLETFQLAFAVLVIRV